MIFTRKEKANNSLKSIIRAVKLVETISPKYFVLTLIFTVLSAIVPALSVYATKVLINAIQTGLSDIQALFPMLLLYASVRLGIIVLRNIYSYVTEQQSLYVTSRLDVICLEKTKDLRLKDFEDAQTYDSINRANEIGKSRIFGIYRNILVLLESVLSVMSIYTVIMGMDKKLFLLVLILPIVSTVVNMKLGKKNYNMLRKRTPRNRKLSYINYLLTNNIAIKEIINYGCHDYLINKYREINNGILNENRRFSKLRTAVNSILSIFEEIFSVFVVFCVIIITRGSSILVGDIVAYINSLTLISDNVKGFLLCTSNIYEDRLFVEDFFTFLDIEKEDDSYKREIERIRTIEFEDVNFSYGNSDTAALKDISICFDAKRPIAIIGENGSGKTTLIKLIAGLYNSYSGRILVNDTELKTISSDSYRKRIGIIFQDFNKYEMTLRENLGLAAIGKINSDDELRAALKLTNLDTDNDFNLETQMGSWFGGRELSKGQWQRIAIARTIIKDCDILILDEPTSALDPIMEKEIFKLIREISENKMLIFITHRVSNLLEFDPDIFVMEKGRIVCHGYKEELMNNISFVRLLTGSADNTKAV